MPKPIAIMGIAAVALVGTISNADASTPVPHKGATSVTIGRSAVSGETASTNATAAGVAGCVIPAQKPFFVTYHGPVYGQAPMTCTVPPPDACHVVIALRKQEPYGNWVTVAQTDYGWTACKAKTYQTSYKCASFASNSEFNTESSLTIEWQGKYGSDAEYGDSAALACA
jgi:hypothetical protein